MCTTGVRGQIACSAIMSENREQTAPNARTMRQLIAEDRRMSSLVFKLERMPTPCGDLLIATDEAGALRGLDWVDHEFRLRQLLRQQYSRDAVQLTTAARAVSDASQVLGSYFAGDLRAIDALVVRTGGTPFQREVWAALRTIPAGQTLSYGALAVRLDRPNAVRAVGMANGANPVSIVVPCHRVIGTDGSLTGYGGGLPRKRWLLEHEGVRLKDSRRAA
jgi:methylated-DNA-[protein]-cysteine S-methyltransferase